MDFNAPFSAAVNSTVPPECNLLIVTGSISAPPSFSYVLSIAGNPNAEPPTEDSDIVTGDCTLTDEQWSAWFHPPTQSFIAKCLAENLGLDLEKFPPAQ